LFISLHRQIFLKIEFQMVQIKKDDATEELIKNTAKKIFFGEGKFNATTQEIADAAGINRTLINYYFRSRDKLFEIVLQDAQEYEQKRTESSIF
jgi:AcrR family transcriptional regulator